MGVENIRGLGVLSVRLARGVLCFFPDPRLSKLVMKAAFAHEQRTYNWKLTPWSYCDA